MTVSSAAARLRGLSPQWLVLLLIIRIATAATAVVLLSVHFVSRHDDVLIAVAIGYTAISAAAVRWWPALILHPLVWLVDTATILTLVGFTGDWRSPFYLLALTTLATPAAAVRPSRALLVGSAFSLAYALLAHFIGPDPLQLGAQTSVETLATHLILPVLLAFGISYAAETVRSLHKERRRAQRLAIEAERRRIAWELHDSAKQRVHAAHLVLDSLPVPDDERSARAVGQVLSELRAAAADMDTSVAELRSPLEGRPLDVALRERCLELSVDGGPEIVVQGAIGGLEPLEAAHAYRIAAEAMTNAVRHARASRIEVTLATYDGAGVIVVADDGAGFPARLRPGANGLRAMRNRAATIGGEVTIEARPVGSGTRVELRFPVNGYHEEPA